MNKFNSKRRNKNQEVKKARAERRKAEGRPQRQDTSKVAAIARTGKGRKKLEKKWRKEQREALVAGKISLEDVATFCNPTEGEAEFSHQGGFTIVIHKALMYY
eukprot:jgi/Mesvir1/27862/Mv07531-RA.1